MTVTTGTGGGLVASGIEFGRLQPGSLTGPNGELQEEVLGGRSWQQFWFVGEESDEFVMAIPDIRMPANQYWPMHWHDEWIAVVVLDGSVLLGDWWMERGDVVISAENFEYGPLVNGTSGCQLLEVFARGSFGGGYGREYHDHPTLVENLDERLVIFGSDLPASENTRFNFVDRPEVSRGNAGNSTLPVAKASGLTPGRLKGGQRWELGEANDPDRGVMLDTRLGAGERVAPHHHSDGRWILVFDGSMTVGDRTVTRDDIVTVPRDVPVPAIEAGPGGVHLVEFVRTAAGVDAVFD